MNLVYNDVMYLIKSIVGFICDNYKCTLKVILFFIISFISNNVSIKGKVTEYGK